MANSEEIKLIIQASTDNAVKAIEKLNGALSDTDKQSKKTESLLTKLKDGWSGLAGGLTAVVAVVTKSAQAFSDSEEATDKFNKTFTLTGTRAAEIAKELSDSFLLTSGEAKRLMSGLDMLLEPLGFSANQATELSGTIIKLAADMASFADNGATTADAVRALEMAISGNYRGLRDYKVILDDVVIKNKAMADGLIGTNGQMTESVRVTTALKLITEDQAKAIGNLQKEKDNYTNTLKAMNNSIGAATKSMGEMFAPAVKLVANLIRELVNLFVNADPIIKAIITSIALAGTAFGAAAAAAKIFGQTLSFSFPIFTALSLAILGIINATQNFDKAWNAVGDSVRNLGKSMLGDMNKVTQGFVQEAQNQTAANEINNARSLLSQKQTTEQKISAEQEYLNQLLIMHQNSWAKEQADMELDYQKKVEYLNKQKLDLEAYLLYRSLLEEEMAAKRDAMRQQEEQKDQQSWQKKVQFAQMAIGAISGLFNQLTSIANQYYTNMNLKMDQEYQKRKKLIELSTMSEEEKAAALQSLDEETDKKKRKLAREQAILGKKIAIVQAIINTAQGVTSALALGLPGLILAPIIAALGATQVALISKQPIPEAYEGALIQGSSQGTVVRAGERGNTEAIIPLENQEAMDKLNEGLGGGKINVTFNVQNLFANEDFPRQAAEKIDAALYKLWQSRSSRFAEALS